MDFCVKDVPVSHEYDVLVAGSAVFGAPDPAEAVRRFKEI